MKYILFFLLFFLSIIQLDAKHNRHHTRKDKYMKSSKLKDTTNIKKREKTEKPKSSSSPSTPKRKANPSKIVKYADDATGSGYVFGSSGQVLTDSSYRGFKRDHPKQVTNESKKWRHKRVYDCSGLVKKAFEQEGINLPHNADEAWRKTKWQQKGDMKSLPKDKVSILYRRGKDGMKHTAIYCGDGTVIEASGEKKGVIKTKYDSTKWSNWGIPEGLY